MTEMTNEQIDEAIATKVMGRKIRLASPWSPTLNAKVYEGANGEFLGNVKLFTPHHQHSASV